ncbi:MAG TPA: DUF2924 domain-containing protein [Smithella sp.]|nr:DUF2924 domain-containing protein [Smithella sp.]
MKHRLSHKAVRFDELAGLPALNRKELVEKWQLLYGTTPPVGVRNYFLLHGIAHRMQEKAFGGLKPATRHFLAKAAQDNDASKLQPLPAISIKPGTKLLREWHGITYEVIILESSVMCNGKHYRSLSEVARAITGTRWSGPLFFGMKKKEDT